MRLAPARRCLGLLALLTATVTGCEQSAGFRPPFRIDDGYSKGGNGTEPGVVGLGVVGRLYVEAPFTVRRVQPFQVDAEVEVLGFRAAFYGRGITPSGHRADPEYLGGACTRRWPMAGFGPTYPVEGLTVTPGDDLTFIVYFRSYAPGIRNVQGFRVDYQTPDGRQSSAHGEANTLVHYVHPVGKPPAPGSPDFHAIDCNPDLDFGWTRQLPGYPP